MHAPAATAVRVAKKAARRTKASAIGVEASASHSRRMRLRDLSRSLHLPRGARSNRMRAPVPGRAALRREHEDRSAPDGAEIDGRGRPLDGKARTHR